MADRLLGGIWTRVTAVVTWARPAAAGVMVPRTSWAGVGTLTPRTGGGTPLAGTRGPHLRGATAAGTWQGLRTAWRRYRTRQSIAGLDAHALRDIGVSYAEAEFEANKPFWRS